MDTDPAPWPVCQHHDLHHIGSQPCRDDATFVLINLTTLFVTRVCEGHLADAVILQSEATYEPSGGEHPILVRLLNTGGIGWPTSGA